MQDGYDGENVTVDYGLSLIAGVIIAYLLLNGL